MKLRIWGASAVFVLIFIFLVRHLTRAALSIQANLSIVRGITSFGVRFWDRMRIE